MCLSQAKTWISNIICCCLFYIKWSEVRCDCFFFFFDIHCSLSFHNYYENLLNQYISPLLISLTSSAMKKWHYKRGGLSWGDNLEVFAFEIWPDKRDDLWWEWSDKRGDLWWEWPDKRDDLWWEWSDKRGDLGWEWSDKRGDLGWEWPYKRGTTV